MVTNRGCQLRHFMTMEAESISKTVLLLCSNIHYPKRLHLFSHLNLHVLWNIMNEFVMYKTRNVPITLHCGEFM